MPRLPPWLTSWFTYARHTAHRRWCPLPRPTRRASERRLQTCWSIFPRLSARLVVPRPPQRITAMSADWQAFWTSWQFDAWLTLALALTAAIYFRGWLRLRQRGVRRFDRGRLTAFVFALTTVGTALESPIEPFSSMLLQMHMLQHVLVIFVAPPPGMAGRPRITTFGRPAQVFAPPSRRTRPA